MSIEPSCCPRTDDGILNNYYWEKSFTNKKSLEQGLSLKNVQKVLRDSNDHTGSVIYEYARPDKKIILKIWVIPCPGNGYKSPRRSISPRWVNIIKGKSLVL